MYDKCPDCITPAGTRCESEPSNCPYHEKAQQPKFKVVCDKTNNSPKDRENNALNVDIYIYESIN